LALDFKKVQFTEEFFGPYLLESITKGLYVDPLHAVREYVQNGVESEPPATEVKVALQGKTLSIWDNGGGMDEEELKIAIMVGRSTKNPRDYFGFRGLGIYSGVPICRRILLSTKREGESKRLFLEIDAEGLSNEIESETEKTLTKLLTDHVSKADMKDVPSAEHGTHVQLIDILDDCKDHFTKENISYYMSQVLPVDFGPHFPYREDISTELRKRVHDYLPSCIYFNGTPIYRPPDITDIEKPTFEIIRDQKGNPLAFYWFCMHKDDKQIEEEGNSGIVYKKKGFTVGNNNTCLNHWFPSSQHLFYWCVGEVHVIADLKPNSERTDFEDEPLKRTLIDELKTRLWAAINEEARKRSYLTHLERNINKLEQVPSKAVFTSLEEKTDRIREISDAKGAILRDQKKKDLFKFASPSLKSKIPSMVRKAKRVQRAYHSTPIGKTKTIPSERGEGPGEISPKKQPRIPSLIDAIQDLDLTQEAKDVLTIIEEILDEYFSKNPNTSFEIKQKIIENLQKALK